MRAEQVLQMELSTTHTFNATCIMVIKEIVIDILGCKGHSPHSNFLNHRTTDCRVLLRHIKEVIWRKGSVFLIEELILFCDNYSQHNSWSSFIGSVLLIHYAAQTLHSKFYLFEPPKKHFRAKHYWCDMM
ncbi:hypothetical protein L798_02464 [Zootermopsis nevadensis]|uniref:Uncharacterized protein n=1 Tax=Zootermopsis nevadensis TaxID=136037 RepID=A0A067QGW0_ZOONE|nr:hypothetical protein L798_02464 [Zootermopsis nevadensis]